MNRFLAILAAATLLAAVPCSAAPGVGDKLSISVTNRYGDVFTNLTVVQIVVDGIVLEHKSGQMKVKYENLPQDVREKYQPMAGVIAKKELEQGATNAAYAVRQEQLQSEQTKAREQIEQQRANMLFDKSIDVPGQGWKIVVLDHGLEEVNRQSNEDLFVYTAAGKDGFSLTIFVQKPPADGGDNEDAFKYYWARASENLTIDKDTLKAERAQNFIKVSFTTGGVPHAVFYFAFRGKWAAVHITKSPYRASDAKLFADFDSRLSYY